ncbi:flagellar protein FlgN [Achromobacter xylosoxidans]|uniref:Flagellar protein FlgN n=2 Tax=Alcaligenaceae TaxID=506 RepID=A0A424W682_ALCXX|nr:flagellar protein FlgN [Achromobacter xylosoxidans]
MTMSTVDALQSCMQQEDTLITEFSTVLEEETEVLVGLGTVGVLQEITERKGGLARKLVDLSQVRDSLLAEIGLPAGHTGTEQAAVLHPQLSGVWQSLLSKSAAANEINLRNGALIDVHLRYTQQSLDALRNVGAAGGAPSTYDARGRGARGTPGRKPIVAG